MQEDVESKRQDGILAIEEWLSSVQLDKTLTFWSRLLWGNNEGTFHFSSKYKISQYWHLFHNELFSRFYFKWNTNFYIYLNRIKKPTKMIMCNKKNCAFFLMPTTWSNNERYLKLQISSQDKIFLFIQFLFLT